VTVDDSITNFEGTSSAISDINEDFGDITTLALSDDSAQQDLGDDMSVTVAPSKGGSYNSHQQDQGNDISDDVAPSKGDSYNSHQQDQGNDLSDDVVPPNKWNQDNDEGMSQQEEMGNDDFINIAPPSKWNSDDTSDDQDFSFNNNDMSHNFQLSDTNSDNTIWDGSQQDWNMDDMRRRATKHQQKSKIETQKLSDNDKSYFGHQDSIVPEEYWINNNDLLLDRDHDEKITEGDVIIDKNGQFLVSANHGSDEFQVLEFVDKENNANKDEQSNNSQDSNDDNEITVPGEQPPSPVELPAKHKSRVLPPKSEHTPDHSSYDKTE